MATPHLQRVSGLLCAVLQHFASTAQHWASEDGLRMINQLISFKSVALIIVMSPVPHSSLELQHTVSTDKVLDPIGPGKNHAGTRAFHLRQIIHQLWKQQWLNLTFRGYQAPCLSSIWMVLERFVCNRSTFSLGRCSSNLHVGILILVTSPLSLTKLLGAASCFQYVASSLQRKEIFSCYMSHADPK